MRRIRGEEKIEVRRIRKKGSERRKLRRIRRKADDLHADPVGRRILVLCPTRRRPGWFSKRQNDPMAALATWRVRIVGADRQGHRQGQWVQARTAQLRRDPWPHCVRTARSLFLLEVLRHRSLFQSTCGRFTASQGPGTDWMDRASRAYEDVRAAH